MKKMILLGGLALSLFAGFRADAQVRVNINIGGPVVQQPWYGADEDYYYMPDEGVYYNVSRQMYVYPESGQWLYGRCLPQRYGGYTWNSGRYYRVHGRAPFERDGYYRQQYAQGYGRGGGYGRGYEGHPNSNGGGYSNSNNGYHRGNNNYGNNGGGRGYGAPDRGSYDPHQRGFDGGHRGRY